MKCDLCKSPTNTIVYNMTSHEGLCDSCLKTISDVLTIHQWQAALEADRERNASQVEILIAYAEQVASQEVQDAKQNPASQDKDTRSANA